MKKITVILLQFMLLLLLAACSSGAEQPNTSSDPSSANNPVNDPIDEPFRDEELPYDTLEALRTATGIDIILPDAVEGYTLSRLFSYSDRVAVAEYTDERGSLYYQVSKSEDLSRWMPDDYDRDSGAAGGNVFFGGTWYTGEPLYVDTLLTIVEYGEKVNEYGNKYDDWEHFIRVANWKVDDQSYQLEWTPGVSNEGARGTMEAFLAYMEPEKWDPSIIEGDRLTLRLNENPTTGLIWSVQVTGGLFEPEGDEYIADDVSQNVAGAGGEHVYTYRATKPGEATISLLLGYGDPDDFTNAQWIITYRVAQDLSIEVLSVE